MPASVKFSTDLIMAEPLDGSKSEPVGPPFPGECVVCGKETFDRCSECARGGVTWMCFCSREHQKLLWSIHKRVCGGRFEWPALGPDEVVEMVKLSKRPANLGAGTTTWMKLWMESNLSPTERVRNSGLLKRTAIFESYLECLGASVENSPSKQQLLKLNRWFAFDIKRKTGKLKQAGITHYQELRRLIISDPFGYLVHSQDCLGALEGCQDATWLSDFQHRAIILVATFTFLQHSIVQSATELDAQFKQAMGFVVHASTEVEKLAREVIQLSHPQEAKSILEDYLPDMLHEAGVYIRRKDASLEPSSDENEEGGGHGAGEDIEV
ncbi:hypothetical protein JCM5353_000789 [Sporobolomyces roseus]